MPEELSIIERLYGKEVLGDSRVINALEAVESAAREFHQILEVVAVEKGIINPDTRTDDLLVRRIK